MDTMRLNEEDDDYFLDDEEYEDDKIEKKSIFTSKKNDDYYDDEDAEPKPRFFPRSSSKVVPMKRSMEVSLVKPTSIEDSREICDYLLAGKAVVLNMEGIHTEVAQRIIDFTSGATYSMNETFRRFPIIFSSPPPRRWSFPATSRIFCPTERSTASPVSTFICKLNSGS